MRNSWFLWVFWSYISNLIPKHPMRNMPVTEFIWIFGSVCVFHLTNEFFFVGDGRSFSFIDSYSCTHVVFSIYLLASHGSIWSFPFLYRLIIEQWNLTSNMKLNNMLDAKKYINIQNTFRRSDYDYKIRAKTIEVPCLKYI